MAVGVTADIKGEHDFILTGAKDGVTKFNLETGEHEYITKLWAESEGPEKVRRSVNMGGWLIKTEFMNQNEIKRWRC